MAPIITYRFDPQTNLLISGLVSDYRLDIHDRMILEDAACQFAEKFQPEAHEVPSGTEYLVCPRHAVAAFQTYYAAAHTVIE